MKLQIKASRSRTSSPRPSLSQRPRHSKARISDGQIHEIHQVFAQLEANQDGKISAEELRSMLALLGEETTREEAALMVREVDTDGDGYIDLCEFVGLNARCLQGKAEDEEMAAALAIFDLDKDGQITAEELQEVLRRLGGGAAGQRTTTVEDCKRMIRGVDR